jgi:hypothetical protein
LLWQLKAQGTTEDLLPFVAEINRPVSSGSQSLDRVVTVVQHIMTEFNSAASEEEKYWPLLKLY